MSLVGIPLILLTALLAVVAVVATVRGWRLLPVRIVGLIAVEVLVVACLGLIANRSESFYPSWQALGGDTGAAVVTPTTAGRLDAALHAAGAIDWSPPEAARWQTAVPPVLIVPPDYAEPAGRSFPVLVALTTRADAAQVERTAAATPGVVTVLLVPTRATTAATLGTLGDSLSRDVRSTASVALLADPPWAALAASWPGHPVVTPGHTAAAFASAVRDLPSPLAAPQRLPSLTDQGSPS
ncbi:hypothetical protein [Actinoplanes awajinensis]|uniref:Uncharacterized protein n=1 Tax=Actinoplanes awajinensis subsp. mycoplanecinus TaxID=135947 RepID=A0A124G9A9_9ACTN|nr:hypothetical protein [Actinoplanes awajinensis]KUL28555.1 hypothetical protein ADL15_31935 [Actinoplanes awajinensis subsp. mycoplanecinus]